MRPSLASLAGCVAIAVVCLAGCDSTAAVTYPRYQFTCCARLDVQKVWNPGETLSLAWDTVPTSGGANAQGESVTLTATLTGPYPSADTLKAGGGASRNLRANPITASDAQPGNYTSVIALPAALPTGFYNLETATVFSSGASSGATIIQVR
ncbi:MAG: hypothetical protein M3019_10770 [Candidatus Dormibacteraeota bacterium]|nr:hypothetical protein [Candidatus Dormibacteraeota bacterium]